MLPVVTLAACAAPLAARGRGQAHGLRLNGRKVLGRFTIEDMLVPPQCFGDSTRVEARWLIEARIVDSAGRTLIEAKPVAVTMRPVRVEPHGRTRPVPPTIPMPRR